jgi:hypothetical protein
LFPSITEKFLDSENQSLKIAVHIRRLYEETGYLLTKENNKNQLATYGRTLPIGDTALFFGIPNTAFSVNGLGVFSSPTDYNITVNEFLIRDSLTCEEYFYTKYDAIDFYDRDIDIEELEFFNPLSNKSPWNSWSKKMESDCSIARKSEFGPFFRTMRMADGSLQFADELIEPQNHRFASYEFRRLYFALKAHYNKPLEAVLTRIDSHYSRICLRGRLPNREYYFLLLLSWPINNAFDMVNFLVKNEFIPIITDVLTNIGILIKGKSFEA